jgi:antitoxin (DNA-binding transcriptional repressor) of toxin-antitoxin stability system
MSMQASVHAAKTHLSRLLEAALAGEEVIIAKGSKPVGASSPSRRAGSSRA